MDMQGAWDIQRLYDLVEALKSEIAELKIRLTKLETENR